MTATRDQRPGARTGDLEIAPNFFDNARSTGIWILSRTDGWKNAMNWGLFSSSARAHAKLGIDDCGIAERGLSYCQHGDYEMALREIDP